MQGVRFDGDLTECMDVDWSFVRYIAFHDQEVNSVNYLTFHQQMLRIVYEIVS